MFSKQQAYYRLITHAFIHANWSHLLLNMLVLYFFGNTVEIFFAHYFGNLATLYFLLLYFGGILFSNLWSLRKYKNNYNYNAVGASGAVASVLFAFIFFAPWEMLYLFGILPIPGIIFGVGYLFYSLQMTKQNQDHIAHDAHLLGAVFGFILPILLNPKLFSRFKMPKSKANANYSAKALCVTSKILFQLDFPLQKSLVKGEKVGYE